MSGKDSYITAYENKSNDNTAYKEAMKLLAREDVQGRLKELRKPLELHAQTSALTETERIKAILWEELENARQQQDHTAVARYADQINKLNGAYKDNSTAETTENEINNVDTAKLLKIVNTAC
jgi:hypothetical protein